MSKKYAVALHLKSFLASPMRYLSSWRRLSALGTQVQRWSDIKNIDTEWDERTAIMAAMIAPRASVLEFGSGREQLEKFLPEGCTYQPSDIVARSARTLVCDLNIGFPQLPQRYDTIIFSGVIEYIQDLEFLFEQVRVHCGECIVSYALADQLHCVSTRMENGWVNHLPEESLIALFKKAGFSIAEKKAWRQQMIYKLQ